MADAATKRGLERQLQEADDKRSPDHKKAKKEKKEKKRRNRKKKRRKKKQSTGKVKPAILPSVHSLKISLQSRAHQLGKKRFENIQRPDQHPPEPVSLWKRYPAKRD